MSAIKQVKQARKDYLAALAKVRATKAKWNSVVHTAALESKTLKQAVELVRLSPWCLEHGSSGKVHALYKWIEFSSSIDELLPIINIVVSSMARKNKFDLSRVWMKWDELSSNEVERASTSDQLMLAYQRARANSTVIEKMIRKLVTLSDDVERTRLILQGAKPNYLGYRLVSSSTKIDPLAILENITKEK